MATDLSGALEGLGPARVYHPRLARFFGSLTAAVFVQQLFFLQKICHNKTLGVYKTIEEWTEEVGLSRCEQRTVRKALKDRGYLNETHDRRAHRIYYKLDMGKLNKDFAGWSEAQLPNETNFKNSEGDDVASRLNMPKSAKKTGAAPGPETDENTGNSRKAVSSSTLGQKVPFVIQKPHRQKPLRQSTDVDMRPGRTHAADTVEETLARVQLRVSRKRAEKAAPARATGHGLRITPPLLRATWQEVMLRHHPKVPALGLDTKGTAILRNCLTPLLATASLHDILTFFAEHWATLRATKFAWLAAKGGTVSEAPSLTELIRYWRVFARAFADHQAIQVQDEARMVVSAEERLMADNRELLAKLSKAEGELATTRKRLHTAERAAHAPAPPPRDTRTLTERRDALPDDLEEAELPDWR